MLFLQASSKREDVSTSRIFHLSLDLSFTSQMDVELEDIKNDMVEETKVMAHFENKLYNFSRIYKYNDF